MNDVVRGLSTRLILVLVASIFSVGCYSPGAENCAVAERMARDPLKVGYLRAWVEEQVRNNELARKLGPSGSVYAIDDPTGFLESGIDHGLLGLDARSASISLHGRLKSGGAYMDETDITAVSVGQGRSGVLIVLDDSDVMSIREIAGDGELRSFSDNVFVFCRH